MSTRLTDGDYAPAQIAEDLPEARSFRIDGGAAGFFVRVKKVLAGAKPSDRFLIVAEAPGTHAHPSDVFHRIAEMRQLPIEDRSHAFGTENDIADPVIAVDERLSRSPWNAVQKPSEGEFERRMWFEREASKVFLVALDLGQRCTVTRFRQEVELVFDRIDPMNLRENLGELRRHRITRAGIGVVAEQSARNSFAVDAFHVEKRRTEHCWIFGNPEHFGHRNAFFESCSDHHELVAAIGGDVVSARIAPQHHRASSSFAATLHRTIERPDFARRATGHLAKIVDRDAIEAAFSANEAGQTADHFARVDFLHRAHSLLIKMSIMKFRRSAYVDSSAIADLLRNSVAEQIEAENRKADRESRR